MPGFPVGRVTDALDEVAGRVDQGDDAELVIAQRVVREVARVGVVTIRVGVLAVQHEVINIPPPPTPQTCWTMRSTLPGEPDDQAS